MGRAPCCDKANVKKGPWSLEEDAELKVYVQKYGTGGNWITLPHKIGLKRCGKSCRLRWLNYLRPNLKHGGFTEEEDNIICSLYISIGSRWSLIAAQLPGRTDNDIKNYWNTRLKKKLLGSRKRSDGKGCGPGSMSPRADGSQDESSYNQSELSSSALDRLRLHMQLQGFPNPLSNLYNNPGFWPTLHPSVQQKLIQSLHFHAQRALPETVQHDPLKFITENTDNLASQFETYLWPCFDDGSSTPVKYNGNIMGSDNNYQFSNIQHSKTGELDDIVISTTGALCTSARLSQR